MIISNIKEMYSSTTCNKKRLERRKKELEKKKKGTMMAWKHVKWTKQSFTFYLYPLWYTSSSSLLLLIFSFFLSVRVFYGHFSKRLFFRSKLILSRKFFVIFGNSNIHLSFEGISSLYLTIKKDNQNIDLLLSFKHTNLTNICMFRTHKQIHATFPMRFLGGKSTTKLWWKACGKLPKMEHNHNSSKVHTTVSSWMKENFMFVNIQQHFSKFFSSL